MKVFDFVGICLFTKGFVSEGILPEGIFSDSQLFFLFVALDFSSNFDFSNQLQNSGKLTFQRVGKRCTFAEILFLGRTYFFQGTNFWTFDDYSIQANQARNINGFWTNCKNY